MTTEVPQVDREEIILRRIYIGPGYFNPASTPPVERGAFLPNSWDVDGISLYIERLTSAGDLVRNARLPMSQYVVARMKANDFYNLGLSLVPDQRPDDLPGHVIVREFTHDNYKNRPEWKLRIKEAAALLAKIASGDLLKFEEVTPT